MKKNLKKVLSLLLALFTTLTVCFASVAPVSAEGSSLTYRQCCMRLVNLAVGNPLRAGAVGTAAGGTAPYTYTASGLPAGLTVGETSGFLKGTPTAEVPAGSFTVTVKDNAGASASLTVPYDKIAAQATVIESVTANVPTPAAGLDADKQTEIISYGSYACSIACWFTDAGGNNWKGNSFTFEEGTQYWFKLCFYAMDGYVFSDDLSGTINGEYYGKIGYTASNRDKTLNLATERDVLVGPYTAGKVKDLPSLDRVDLVGPTPTVGMTAEDFSCSSYHSEERRIAVKSGSGACVFDYCILQSLDAGGHGQYFTGPMVAGQSYRLTFYLKGLSTRFTSDTVVTYNGQTVDDGYDGEYNSANNCYEYVFTPQANSGLAFTDSPDFDIPESSVSTPVSPVLLTPGVRGGTPPYSFTASGLPDGLLMLPYGCISGIPKKEQAAGDAQVIVRDAAGNSKTITVHYGAVGKASLSSKKNQLVSDWTQLKTALETEGSGTVVLANSIAHSSTSDDVITISGSKTIDLNGFALTRTATGTGASDLFSLRQKTEGVYGSLDICDSSSGSTGSIFYDCRSDKANSHFFRSDSGCRFTFESGNIISSTDVFYTGSPRMEFRGGNLKSELLLGSDNPHAALLGCGIYAGSFQKIKMADTSFLSDVINESCSVTIGGSRVSRRALISMKEASNVVVSAQTAAGSAPLIYDVNYPACGVGVEFPAYTPSAENHSSGSIVWSAENLPDGLVIEPGTGRLTGIPTAPGTRSFTLTATNSAGSSSQDCTLHIYSPTVVSDWDMLKSAIEDAGVSFIQLGADLSHSEVYARSAALLSVSGSKIFDLNGHVLSAKSVLEAGFDWNDQAATPEEVRSKFLQESGGRELFTIPFGSSLEIMDASPAGSGRIDFTDETNYFEDETGEKHSFWGNPGNMFLVIGSLTIRSGTYNSGDSWTHRQHNGIVINTTSGTPNATRIYGGTFTGRYAVRADNPSGEGSMIYPAGYPFTEGNGVVSGINTVICGGTFIGIGGADAVCLTKNSGSTIYGGTFKTEARKLYRYYGKYASGIGGEAVTDSVDGRTLPKNSASCVFTSSTITKLSGGVKVTKNEIEAAAEDQFQSDVKIVPDYPSVFIAALTIHKGVTYTLTAVAAPAGGGTLDYQWYTPDGNPIPGETKPTYDIRLDSSDTTPDGTILYYSCSVTERPSMLRVEMNATLTVSDEKVGPEVTVTPKDTVLYYGMEPSSVTLTAAVRSGSAGAQGMTCQWYKNSTAISGATALTYTASCLDLNAFSAYKCVVTDSAGMSDSDSVTVTSRRNLEVRILTQKINGIPGTMLNKDISVGGYLGGSDVALAISDTTPLPEGLSLENGAIVGIPAQSGTYALLVTATLTRFPLEDYPEATDTQVVMLYVYDRPEIAEVTLPDAREGTAYSQQLSLSKGITGNPVEWSLENRDRICFGLSLGSGGEISGTPDIHDTGTYYFEVRARDTVTGQSSTRRFTLNVLGKPGAEYENVYSAADGYKTLSDGTSISFAQGDYGSYFFRLHGSAAGTITFTGLPAGFTFAYDDTLATYVLRGSTNGIVTAAAGSYPVTVTANCGAIGTVAYTLTLVVSSKPIITTSNSDLLTQLGASGSKYASAVVGKTYSMVIECTSTENIVSWSFIKPTLDKANEDGMTITMDSSNHKKATVTWTAALTQTDSGGNLKDPSSATFSVIATNASGVSSELVTYDFDVVGSTKAPTFIALQDEKGNPLSTMSRGMQYSIFNNNNVRVVSDCAPRGYITATGLPEGLTVNNNIYGEQLLSNMKSFISGFTTAPAGVYPVTFTVVNPNTNASYSQTLNLTIIEPQTAPAPIFSLPGGTYSSTQSLQISCSIGVPFYRVEDENGNTLVISDGKIKLNDDGTVKTKTLTGEMWQDFDVGNVSTRALFTPLTLDRTVTVYAYTLGSMDTLLNSPVVSQKYIINSGAEQTIHILTSALPGGKAGAAYSASLSAAESGVSWSAEGLPAGLSLNASTGAISGTPAAAGTYQVSIAAGSSGISPAKAVLPLVISDKDAKISATPTVQVTPSSSSVAQYAGGTTISASVSGSNGGAVLVTWYVSEKAGTLGKAAGAGFGYTASSEYVGTKYYTPVVTNTEAGCVTKEVTGPSASVTVNANAETPSFDASASYAASCPADKTCALEAYASVSDGGTLTYSWWKMTGTVPGSSDEYAGSDAELEITPTGSAGTAKYYVDVTNTNSSVAGIQTAHAESPVYTVTFTAAEGVKFKGLCTSFGSDETAKTTIQLIAYGTSEAAYETSVAGTGGKIFSVTGVTPGTYTARVMKKNHVTREYTVTVSDALVTQDVAIWLLGDVNGDGKVNVADYVKVLAQAKGTASLSAYAFACGDVNGDKKINVADYVKVLAHAKNSAPLW